MDNTKKKLIGAGAVLLVLLLAAGGWWMTRSPKEAPLMVTANINGKPTTIPVQFAGLKDGTFDTSSIIKDMMERRKKEMEDYAKLSPAEKKKFLDAKIDEQEKMRKDTKLPDLTTRPAGTTTEQTPNGMKVTVVQRGNEKGMMEEIDPLLRAQIDQFRKDLAQRRAERGLPESNGMMMKVQITR